MCTRRGQCHHIRYAGTLHVALKNHVHGTWTDISTWNSPEDPSKPSILWHGYQWRFDFFSEIGGIVEDEVNQTASPEDFRTRKLSLEIFPSLWKFDRTSLKKRFWTHRKQKASHQIQSSPLLQYTFELRSLSSSISWQSRRIFTAAFQKRWSVGSGGHPARARLECDRPWGQGKPVFPKLWRLGDQKSYLSIACQNHVFALCDGIVSYIDRSVLIQSCQTLVSFRLIWDQYLYTLCIMLSMHSDVYIIVYTCGNVLLHLAWRKQCLDGPVMCRGLLGFTFQILSMTPFPNQTCQSQLEIPWKGTSKQKISTTPFEHHQCFWLTALKKALKHFSSLEHQHHLQLLDPEHPRNQTSMTLGF